MKKLTLPLLILLTLAACATPTTQHPLVSQDELAAEQAWEQNSARSNPFPPIVEPVYTTQKMKQRLGEIARRISPQASKLCYDIHGGVDKQDCNFGLQIKESHGVNAYADGKSVTVSAPMMVFAQRDTHLAFVVAHELAHNIMAHPQNQQKNVLLGSLLGAVADVALASQGASTGGGFSNLGGSVAMLRYSPAFEQEADYIGLYILARAGYPIEEAPDFWRAMSQYEPEGIYARSTHPTNAERFIGMRKTIAEIRAKQRAHQPLIPNIRPEEQ